MKATVSKLDTVFLFKMTYRMSGLSGVAVQPHGFVPPYAAVMVLFNHLYKPTPAGKVSAECVDAPTASLKAIESSPHQSSASIQKRMFFESCRRHWVKLVEIVISAVVNRGDHLKQVAQSVYFSTNMIGSPSDHVSVTRTTRTTRSTTVSFADQKAALIEHMIPEKVVAAFYLSHALGERAEKIRLNEQPSTPTKAVSSIIVSTGRSERKPYETLMVNGRKVLVKELPISDERRLLYETSIKVGTYGYAVKNNAFRRLKLESYSVEYNFPEFLQRNLRSVFIFIPPISTSRLLVLTRVK